MTVKEVEYRLNHARAEERIRAHINALRPEPWSTDKEELVVKYAQRLRRPTTLMQERYHPYRTPVYHPHFQMSETERHEYHQGIDIGPDYPSQMLPNRIDTHITTANTCRTPHRPHAHSRDPRLTIKCHRCKERGHIRRNCPVTLARIAIGQEMEEVD